MPFLAPRNYYLLPIAILDSNTQVLLSWSVFRVSVYHLISPGLCQGGVGGGLGTYRHSNAFDYFTHVHVDIVYTLT